MNKNQLKKLTSFLFEIGNLRKVLRAHQQVLLSYDLTDTIASHSFRVAIIGYFLAKELKADADKVLKMCLIHDLEETRSMDHHWVSKKYVKIYDDEIRKEQYEGLPIAKELTSLSKEYKERKTIESKIAKDADLLDQTFLLREYEWQGNREASDWLRGENAKGPDGKGSKKTSNQEKLMYTTLAKKISSEAKRQRPSEWWSKAWTPNRR